MRETECECMCVFLLPREIYRPTFSSLVQGPQWGQQGGNGQVWGKDGAGGWGFILIQTWQEE